GNFLAMDPDSGDDDDTLSQNGYTYAENNPITNVDPNGNFIWAAAYFIPVVGEYLAAATLIAAGAYLTGYGVWHLTRAAKSIIMRAQNNKQKKQRIESLEDNIDEHKGWIKKNPKSGAVKHWKHEIRVWESQVARLKKRLRKR
ncbi:MAG: hypothetical protein ABF651_03150, partial [Sporolactobacillus sp.]